MKESRDIEKKVTTNYFVSTLRRIADAVEAGEPINIQVANQRLVIPPEAELYVAHEFEDGEHELELELTWKTGSEDEGDDD